MVDQEYAARLREKSATLPLRPGVYIMKAKNGTVIYVGKSRALKNRVSQYFHESVFNAKTDAMTSFIYDFDYILCDTEIEALTLENSLIKLYKPKYNILLKDDKSYPYLAVTNEDYPRFVMTRTRGKDAKYFGPYTSADTVNNVIISLQKALGLPSCHRKFPQDIGKVRHCLYRHIGCIAVCDGEVSKEKYRELVDSAVTFLSGKTDVLLSSLTEKMQYASDNLMFEAAAEYRDRIKAIQRLCEKQKVVASPDTERDIIAWYSGEDAGAVCVFYIRGGKLIDSESIVFSGGEILDSAAISSFMCSLYEKREYIPKEIDTAGVLAEEDAQTLESFLSERAGYKVTIKTPVRGDLHKLCVMAEENAAQKAKEFVIEKTKSDKTLMRLATIAGLEVVPERIEAFDISNIGDENITAGMVLFEGGKPKKSGYRIFNIKNTKIQDDYASMREAMERRVSHFEDAGTPPPDLFLIDGGIGHISTVQEVLDSHGVTVPALGMVKDDHHKTRALINAYGEEISIAAEAGVYSLIFRIQEEVHRFTVSKMMNAKRKNVKTSVLEEIDGIGKARAKALLSRFGGLSGVKSATEAELMTVNGISRETAKKITEFFKTYKEKII
ncbi:MAG: excinuclease ABC subunit UvrC [Clostridia bacterium]|nr:excinuclease ABC subunit UvrC [Clostridia bacterium]